MLTDPKFRSQVDALWDKFWTGIKDLTCLRESLAFSVACPRGSRLTRATMRHVKSNARAESLRGRMSKAGRQVNGLFESLLSESFGEHQL